MGNIKEVIKKYIIGTHYEWESHFENIIFLCNRHLKSFTPDSFLDVGCGTGERTIRISKHFNIDLTKTYGIDVDEKKTAECSKIFNVERVDLETSDLPYEDNTFDLVICNQVFEHVKNNKKIMLDIARITKNNGYIVLGVPNLAHLINRLYLLFGMQPMCMNVDSSHIRGFTHNGFVKFLGTLDNIRLIDSTGSLMYPLPYKIAKHLSRRFVGLSGFTCYLLKKTHIQAGC